MSEYPNLRQFVAAYLHQDWPDYYATPWDALDDFIRRQGPSDCQSLVREIDSLLDESDEDAVRRVVVDEMGSNYRVEADGLSYVGWLRAVRDRVLAALAEER
jgi:hypothetical protein